MKRPRFHEEQVLDCDSEVILGESSSHHIHTVLRLQEGSELVLFNGQGGEYHGTLVSSHKKHCTVALSTYLPENRQPGIAIKLGQVLGKGDKMEWVIQKATELGVSEITPLTSVHSDYKLKGERLEKKLRQWKHLALSACEQCGLNIPPLVHPLTSLEEWASATSADYKGILHPGEDQENTDFKSCESVAIAVGPEGGFSTQEVRHAMAKGFSTMTLGQRILRTETAAIVAASSIYSLSGRWA